MSERWNEVEDLELLQLEAEMHGELTDLREAATVYADRAWERGKGVATVRQSAQPRWLAWAAAGVAAAALAVGGVRLTHQESVVPAQQENAAHTADGQEGAPVSDEALLEQIQSDLSNRVPAAMVPLQTSDPHASQEAVKQ